MRISRDHAVRIATASIKDPIERSREMRQLLEGSPSTLKRRLIKRLKPLRPDHLRPVRITLHLSERTILRMREEGGSVKGWVERMIDRRVDGGRS